jgi:diaminopropionate ammonia-lyase
MTDYFINQPSNKLPIGLTNDLLRTSQARSYHQALPSYQPTPLICLPALAQRLGVGGVYIKDEAHRFGLNAFKGLGASYAMHLLAQTRPELTTFCTATDGNHGRAVAWAAKLLGKQAQVFVPRDTTAQRIAAIETEGGTVIRVAGNYDQACTGQSPARLATGAGHRLDGL